MGFRDILKRRLQDIHGFAGGNLEDQLSQNPQMIRSNPAPVSDRDAPPIEGTPEWQAAMNHAVPVRANEIPQPAASMSDPNATRQRAVSFDTQTGKPNENFYRDRGDISGLYNAEQNWNPHGAKRGFKNSLKSAAMMAAEAVRNNPNHPLEAAIAGAGVGAIGGTAAPNFKNRLERQWKLQQSGGELQNQLQLQGEQAKIDSLQNKPQVQQAAQQEREINNALTQYNRLEHYDPDDPTDAGVKTYLEARGLHLPKKDKYHRPVASWVNGQLVLTDSTGTRGAEIDGKPLVDQGRVPNEQGLTPNQAAIQGSQTANREASNTRAANVQAGADRRAGMRGTGTTPKADRVTTRKAAQLIGKIERARQAMAQADDALARNPNDAQAKQTRESARQAGTAWATELNSLGGGYEGGPGEKGYPYYKQKAGSQFEPAPAADNPVNTDLMPKGGYKYTEAQVRERAKALGRDADAAVKLAKEHKLIP